MIYIQLGPEIFRRDKFFTTGKGECSEFFYRLPISCKRFLQHSWEYLKSPLIIRSLFTFSSLEGKLNIHKGAGFLEFIALIAGL